MLEPGAYLVWDDLDEEPFRVEITRFVHDSNQRLSMFISGDGKIYNWDKIEAIQKV